MMLVSATDSMVIGGYSYPGFPILLWDSMESCAEANEFMRHYLRKGLIASKKSWPSTGRALYDYFSFLQVHELSWRDVDRGESKNIVAGYRDYCLRECGLARTTTRQRLYYVCKFYVFAKDKGWVAELPFELEERRGYSVWGSPGHVTARGGKALSNNIMPLLHRKLPKFLTMSQIGALLEMAENPHHRMIIRVALHTGLRREEIASFPLRYVLDPDKLGMSPRNLRIHLDPYDGSGMRTKGNKPREIYISRRFMAALHRYVALFRGERASISATQQQTLFLNQFGEPYANDGKGLERIVRNIGKCANLTTHPHMLRHTYATYTLSYLQRNGCDVEPLVYLQRQLGHSSIQSTMIYLHLVNELADEAVLAYDDELADYMD